MRYIQNTVHYVQNTVHYIQNALRYEVFCGAFVKKTIGACENEALTMRRVILYCFTRFVLCSLILFHILLFIDLPNNADSKVQI